MAPPERFIDLPACMSAPLRFDRSIVRQVLVRPQRGVVDLASDRPQVLLDDGSVYSLTASAARLPRDEVAIKAPRAVVAGEQAPTREDMSWIGAGEPGDPDVALASLVGAFRFRSDSGDDSATGLRVAQLGAVHAALGHWTSDPDTPGTIMMPTGTGKTETMVALFAAVMPTRLLVVVPSDALRTQIAGKFETLGVLPDRDVVVGDFSFPIVGQVKGAFSSGDSARAFASRCNVVVTTPAALFASDDRIVVELLDACTHLFVDEAHHVEARTWRRIRDSFEKKHVLQFTATPFREDGQRLDGRQIYRFRLRQAQELGYFAPIDYESVIDFSEPDVAIARRAVERLKVDLEQGFDHILMARVNRIGRAHEIRDLYETLASEWAPVVLNSRLSQRDQRAGLDALNGRTSRIVVCVDMLGEGFDLPALKVAAIHDPHKSLGVTLQYVGRFARVAGSNIGRASVFIGRPDGEYDFRLRRLYAEDADWNTIVSDLSEAATEDEVEVGEFETGFSTSPDDVPMRALAPKMSTVVYRTQCSDWTPENVAKIHHEEDFVTWPIPTNPERRVVWFVVAVRTPVQWADLPGVEQTVHHLYVAYWDAERQLLYINSSNKDSHHEELARAVAGANIERITGANVYRAMHNIQRLVPTNVGLLDVRNRNRRFSLLVGADVSDGFPASEAETKSQTNIFASGFENGQRVTMGASLRGRIWSYRVAQTIKHWVDWCDHIGTKLIDESVSIEQVMGSFIRPVVLDDRPKLVPLAIEWPWEMWLWASEDTLLSYRGVECPLLEAELRITRFETSGPITFEVAAQDWKAPFEASVINQEVVYRATAGEVALVRRRADLTGLSGYLNSNGPLILFEHDAVVMPPALLLQPSRKPRAIDDTKISVIDWNGVNRRRESQGPERDGRTVQARVLRHVERLAAWDVVIDDDGTGEIADIVALRREGDRLQVLLVHCKFAAASDESRVQVADLYEVCGQAQKSVRWRHYVPDMFNRLVRRERRRSQHHGYSGFIAGDGAALYKLRDESRLLRPDFTIAIAQPGLSKSRASEAQRHLLGSTELYVAEVAAAGFKVFCDV